MRRWKKFLLIVGACLLLLLVAGYGLLRRTLPPVRGEIRLHGLQDPVVINRDRWGIPRIEARNRNDLYFAIGFLHASDRLFQMDLTRRMSLGRLSEVFGSRTLNSDKTHKDLLIEESVKKSLDTLGPANREILKHYCDGVNAFITTRTLPPEFTILGYKPEPWTPEDTLSIYKRMEILLSGSGSELYHAKIVEALGAEKAEKFIRGNYGIPIINRTELRDIYRNRSLNDALSGEIRQRENKIGSNSWVISGARTASGQPILANDQHLPNIFPSFFYQITADTPELSLSGNTLPGIPLMLFGRTGYFGWGFTNIGTDVIDYFILEINPDNPNQYRLDSRWIDFEILEKPIRIKNKNHLIHRIRMSRFGPVFEENGQFLARHSIMLYGSTTIDAFLEMNAARDIDEFIAGARKFSSPALNLVFADRKGNIGYYPCGRIPIRNKGYGNIPVGATYESDLWAGFFPESRKPFLLNPEKGYIVTANNPVIPEDELPLFARSWNPYFRADRIDELLSSKTGLTVQDTERLQTDAFLKNAAFLIGWISTFHVESQKARFVLDHLKAWNFRAETGIAPYLFYRFESILNRNIFADDIRHDNLKSLVSNAWIYRLLRYPETATTPEDLDDWADDIRTPDRETFRDMVEKSLIETQGQYQRESENRALSWENLHTLTYRHPLGTGFPLKNLLNRGPYAMPGGYGCILAAAFREHENFDIVHLSAFRMIIDFSDFSKSRMINSSGQSGHFLSPYYDDQIKWFVKLQYRPMETPATESRKKLLLKPFNPTGSR